MAEIDDLNVTDASNTARFPEGMSPATVNDSARALEGLIARWYQDTNCSTASAGSSNAYTLSINSTDTLYDGQVLGFEANHSNTGAATLNVTNSGGSAQGAKAIRKFYNVPLVTGDITAGQKVLVVYDSAEDFFQLLTPKLPTELVQAIGTTEASATTLALDGDGNIYGVSGTATITAVTGVQAGGVYYLVATGAWTMTADGDNIISDSWSTYTVDAGDILTVYAHAANKITVITSPNLASQAVAEAGTNAELYMSALRVAQAIRAHVAVGTYSGDGSTSLAITGLGFSPKFLLLILGGNDGDSINYGFTSSALVDDDPQGLMVNVASSGATTLQDNKILSLDADGFTVSDTSADAFPNTNGSTVHYIAWG